MLAGQVRNCSGDYRKSSRFHRQTFNQSNRCGQNISNSNSGRYHPSTYKILEFTLLNREQPISHYSRDIEIKSKETPRIYMLVEGAVLGSKRGIWYSTIVVRPVVIGG